MMLHPAHPATERADQSLPLGVVRHPLASRVDARGSFTEIFRRNWPVGVEPLQWGLIRTDAGVLRGVHAHPRHDEFVLAIAGTMLLGVKDARVDSPSFGRSALLTLSGERAELVTLPHGVAHGLYHATDSSMLLAMSHYYDPADDIGCHWADPELGIAWPVRDPVLSERDRTAAPFTELVTVLGRTA
jgi:dTDP-4-dehydrorhamnose 3,5-epimerase